LTDNVELISTKAVPLNFDEYTFFRKYYENENTREILKEYVPKWIGNFVPQGKTLDDAIFHDFLIDHPLIKYPYITSGEISHEQVKELVKRCEGLSILP